MKVPDLHATICHALGIDPNKEVMTPLQRPMKLVDNGKPVEELFSPETDGRKFKLELSEPRSLPRLVSLERKPPRRGKTLADFFSPRSSISRLLFL